MKHKLESSTNKINDGGAAFPIPIGHAASNGAGNIDGIYNKANSGMTYRQWLAGMALQGSISRGNHPPEDYAKEAVAAADALIAELEKKSWG